MAMISKRSITSQHWALALLVAAGTSQAACSAPVEGDFDQAEGGESVGSTEQSLVGSCVSNALPRVSATASSVESNALGAANAIDGNPATRWSSAFSDPQWLR